MHSAKPNFVEYSCSDRGSNERTYASARAELPFVSLMRIRFGDYPEDHTSPDDVERVVTTLGLGAGLTAPKGFDALKTEPVLITLTFGE